MPQCPDGCAARFAKDRQCDLHPSIAHQSMCCELAEESDNKVKL